MAPSPVMVMHWQTPVLTLIRRVDPPPRCVDGLRRDGDAAAQIVEPPLLTQAA